LISELAQLFVVCYQIVPTDKERDMAEKFRFYVESSSDWEEVYFTNHVCIFDNHKAKLEDHSATIALFDDALSECSQWPDSDPGVKQLFTPRPVSEAVIKTGWHTTAEGLLKKGAITVYKT
jgi:hypothetical protein